LGFLNYFIGAPANNLSRFSLLFQGAYCMPEICILPEGNANIGAGQIAGALDSSQIAEIEHTLSKF